MTEAPELAVTAHRGHHGYSKPVFRGVIHLLAFSSALTLAPILIVATPGIADRFSDTDLLDQLRNASDANEIWQLLSNSK